MKIVFQNYHITIVKVEREELTGATRLFQNEACKMITNLYTMGYDGILKKAGFLGNWPFLIIPGVNYSPSPLATLSGRA